MTKEVESGEMEGERDRGRGRERERGVISCATEPHSRRGRNSRYPGYMERGLKKRINFRFVTSFDPAKVP